MTKHAMKSHDYNHPQTPLQKDMFIDFKKKQKSSHQKEAFDFFEGEKYLETKMTPEQFEQLMS